MTLGYLFAILIALVFMFYMDGDIGVMMLAFLLLMPLASLIMTLLIRKRVTVSLALRPDTAGKNRQVSAVITLEKDTPLPLPFLRMQLVADPHFMPLNPAGKPLEEPPLEPAGIGGALRYRRAYQAYRKKKRTQLTPYALPLCLSMGTVRKAVYEIPLHPQFCGSGEIRLTEMTLSDYLAMFRFRLKQETENALLITPEIPEQKANSNLFRSVSTAVAAADEETDATPNYSASSMPGYDHRDYIPGDSLKRINWKLSSKRRHLMVRQDEPIALARLSVVLDFRRKPHPAGELGKMLALEEQLIESALGFLMLCAKYGYPCKLCYADEHGAWSSLEIDNGEQLAVEAVTLLRGGFRAQEKLAHLPLLPPQITQENGGVLLYFTACCEAEDAANLEQHPDLLYLLVPEQLAERCAVPKNASLWLVTAERDLVQAGGEM